MEKLTWILVTDTCKATLYCGYRAALQKDASQLKLVSDYYHKNSRKKDIDLVSDKQGHFGSGTFVEATDPKKHENILFAKELANILEHARIENKFQELIIFSPPAFMGLLNSELSKDTKRLIYTSVEKDYASLNLRDFAIHLEKFL